ncbi:AAA family ATPase [Pseudomonas alliivorans]|nr:AAA family ATPase [Pseudomonas alliivorans]MEE4712879.1 AAA family ATPase [Pseudomonas alliivorans]MEE4725392.1 AAA family ATPase [Pseudomonas alliivorans]MEE4765747.1 AAA family ATPase [Pseudomonas alliivorans]MEE5069268.1 AAA family ATPase [Pseudomonas alliivorans]
MHIVSVINYKGGVGKTTVTANLASELAWRGQKVLLIDTDAQASLTFSFVTPDQWDTKYKADKTIKSWFDAISLGKEPPPLSDFVITPPEVNKIVAKAGGKIDLICSHLGLINVDLELATLLGGVNMTQAKKNYIKVHGKLREAIANLAESEDYDIVLIDCPPNFNIVTKNAIVASEQILIPAKPDYLSTLGIDYLQRSVNELVKEFNEYAVLDETTESISPQVLGVIFTMIQITSGKPIAAQRQFISQTKRLGVPTLENYFRENKTIFADAPQALIPVVLNYYSSGTHSDIVTEIEEFVNEFEELLGEI